MYQICKCCGKPKKPKELCKVIAGADLICSSPPFMTNTGGKGEASQKVIGSARFKGHLGGTRGGIGSSPGQLANMPEGNPGLIISSPPFSTAQTGGGINREGYRNKAKRKGIHKIVSYSPEYQGTSPGQLANMKEGKVDICIASPPYAEGIGHGHAGPNADQTSYPERYKAQEKYASAFESEGNLGAMKEGSVELIASSPPYEGSLDHAPGNKRWEGTKPGNLTQSAYSKETTNLGNTSGETFWSAARLILEQCHDLLKPGGHACWVVKSYCKNGKIIDFPGNWRKLCESVGFKTVHEHHALLKKRYGVQRTINGQDKEIETKRVSFFRRLHEQKRPDLAIDWEVVLCMVKE